MKNNYLPRLALATMLSLTGSFYQTNISKENTVQNPINKNLERILKKERIFENKIKEESSDEITPPIYRLKPDHCSQYARLAAKKLFNQEYLPADAWNLRYKNKVAYPIKENEGFKELITSNILRSGMILGVEQPKSRYKNAKDFEGNKVKYTHVLLYVGLNDSGNPEFIHQFGRKMEKITEEDFKEKGFIPKEILTTNQDENYLTSLGKFLDNS